MRPLAVHRLGQIPYREAWALQRELVEQRKAGTIPDTLLLLEHDRVVTLGRDGSRASLLFDEAALAALGVELVESDRGGDATYHGPGQLVAYPILDLTPDFQDIPRFVRALERTMIDTLAEFGVTAEGLPGSPGVWLDAAGDGPGRPRKIGAIGARVSRWITHHGVALNVNTDLADFDLIVPCGIRDKGVTSLARELGHPVPMDDVMAHFTTHLAANFRRVVTDAPLLGDTVREK